MTFDFYDEVPKVVAGNREAIFIAVGDFLARATTIAQLQEIPRMIQQKLQ